MSNGKKSTKSLVPSQVIDTVVSSFIYSENKKDHVQSIDIYTIDKSESECGSRTPGIPPDDQELTNTQTSLGREAVATLPEQDAMWNTQLLP